MLGQKLGELTGSTTGLRVLPPEGAGPKVETTFQISGTILGVQTTMMGTYWSTVLPDGRLYGECPAGVIMTQDGGVGTWTGQGIGRFTGAGGAVSFRGAVYYQSVPPSLGRLASVAALYEWEVDANGNAKAGFWEWK